MTRDDIIRMASDSGMQRIQDRWIATSGNLELFFQAAYNAGTAFEREACAKICDEALIAAAPDLLEALKECLPHLERDDQHINALGRRRPHYVKARAAIAKATGENQ